MTAAETPWLVWWRRETAPRVTLICVANAAAGAAPFRSWAEYLPVGIDLAALRLPGRESRLAEPPIDDLGALARAAVAELAPPLEAPYAFFGHCSGAWAAFEIAREFRRRALPLPVRLVVAAQGGPSLKTTPSQADEDVRERLRKLGGTDRAILDDDVLFELLRPAIEADFRFTDKYCYKPEPPFDFPISVIVGSDDVEVWEDELAAWQAETTRELDIRRLPGDHFFAGADWTRLGTAVGEAALSLPARWIV
jgi:surfactin synthase thioesterase subunit